MTHVVCDAVAFGYGPVGKLLTIIDHLPDTWDVTLLATGTTLTLARRSGLAAEIVECDTEDEADCRRALDRIERPSFLLNVMNPVSATVAASLSIPIAVIDSLFWMWTSLPPALLEADLYFVQNFIGVDARITELAVRNPIRVGPIVDDTWQGKGKRSAQLIIALGGVRSKLSSQRGVSPYLGVMAEILNAALTNHTFDRVLIAADEVALGKMQHEWRIPRSEIACRPHRDFLHDIANAAVVLTSPGLTTTYEAMAYGTPVLFLPPQNYSQYLNLRRLRSVGAAPVSIHWDDYYPEHVPQSLIPEDEGVARTLDAIRMFAVDSEAQKDVILNLRRCFREESWQSIGVPQQTFIRSMGPIGTATIVERVSARFGDRGHVA